MTPDSYKPASETPLFWANRGRDRAQGEYFAAMPSRPNVVAVFAEEEPPPPPSGGFIIMGTYKIPVWDDIWFSWAGLIPENQVSEILSFLDERGITPVLTARCMKHVLLEFHTEAEAVVAKLSHPRAKSAGDMSAKEWNDLNKSIFIRPRKERRRINKIKRQK